MAQGSNAAMKRWLIIGTVLQLLMVISGHYNDFIAQNLFALGGVTISLIAGAGYGSNAAAGRGSAALGGAVVGGGCALIGIAVSVALGDVPPLILALGTASSAAGGAIGGLVTALMRGREAATT